MTSDHSLGARLRHDDPQLSLLSTRNRQVGVQVDTPLIFRPWALYSHPYKPESHVIFGVNHDCGSQWFPDPRVRRFFTRRMILIAQHDKPEQGKRRLGTSNEISARSLLQDSSDDEEIAVLTGRLSTQFRNPSLARAHRRSPLTNFRTSFSVFTPVHFVFAFIVCNFRLL